MSTMTLNFSRLFLSIFDDLEDNLGDVLIQTQHQGTQLINHNKIANAEAALKLSKEVQQAIKDATAQMEEGFFPDIFNFLAAGMIAVSTYAYIA